MTTRNHYQQAIWNEPLLIEQSQKGRLGHSLPRIEGTEEKKALNCIPELMKRENDLDLPSLSEPQVVRHFTRLSQMNFAVDLGMYPLGSCTMKYNPKIAECLAINPKITRSHPNQSPETVQGILKILYELSKMLEEISGAKRVSLAPAAGAQGEFVGALIMQKRNQEREENDRNEMLVPDSAHGTNPASAANAGFNVVKIPSDTEGLVDVKAVENVVSKHTAGMMLTVPNTYGLFEKNVEQIAGIIHDAGGLMYYDGANMNALLGRVRPCDLGFDIVHLNLHKTFSTPHGGGGPGAGPVAVVKELEEFLPIPLIEHDGERYFFDESNMPKSIGKIKDFYGNIGVLFRAYVYIMMLGEEGLRQVSGQAVLAANYLLQKLSKKSYDLPYNQGLPRKHEFVVSAKPLRDKVGTRATDLAKSLLDDGLHAPTIYFPLTIQEAMMIEPTETEAVENLNTYAGALNRIGEIALSNPNELRARPKFTTVGRLNEVQASHPRSISLNWRKIRIASTSNT
ncbi:glycine dehydrogenase (aminomethyl-transferring) [Candidatus Bathyarchaeota archaeon]|nr:glycine dehydrogenase (aminomethyl-transferring) [Nitrososphaerota archaeon]MBQ04025.1 glycine dehydrogenase (aminomethyl-transferring) [Candidatus Bathyarchaeota archaeon]